MEVFNRTEIKYLLSEEDKNALMSLINDHMDMDIYNKGGQTYPIHNIYFDSPSSELIRKSLEKPVYKEKIRLRSYGQVTLSDTVYLESKKKVDSVVYKRRTALLLKDAYDYLETLTEGTDPKIPKTTGTDPQIFKEIDYIVKFYHLQPSAFISYRRLAFYDKGDRDFRLTLDNEILGRRFDLKLELPASGDRLLPPGTWILEAKSSKNFPLWFVQFLSERKIYPASFSKYGTEYKLHINKEN